MNWELFKIENAIPIIVMAVIAVWIVDKIWDEFVE